MVKTYKTDTFKHEGKIISLYFLLSILSSLSYVLCFPFKLRLIDTILANNTHNIWYYLSFIVLSYILVYVFNSLSSLLLLKYEEKYKFVQLEKVIAKLNSLPLATAETEQNTVYMAQNLFEKKLTLAMFFNNIIKAFILMFVFIYYIKFSPLAILVFLLLFLAVVLIDSYSAKKTANFWQKYMAVSRRYNYFSDVLSERNYAYERRIFEFSPLFEKEFEQDFDRAEISILKVDLTGLNYSF